MATKPAPSEPAPRLLIMVIYENDKTDGKWLEGRVRNSCPLSKESDILLHSSNFRPEMLQHSSSFLNEINLSKRVKHLMIEFERKLEEYKDLKKPKPLVLLVGLGFGALVAMKALNDKPEIFASHDGKIIPIGMVLSSVSPNSKTGSSPIFQRWYHDLQDEKNEDMKLLRRLLQRFDGLCREHHIRVSCMTRQEQSEKDFISTHLRCVRQRVEAQENPLDSTDPKLFIFWEHVNRSWPEHLLQLIQDPEASEAEIRKLIRTYRGGLSHEPIVAKVLQKAAAGNQLEIVADLLRYKVHPDVRVRYKDKPAFNSSELDRRIQDRLYFCGAKEYSPNPRFRSWHYHAEEMGEKKEGAGRQERSSNPTNSGKHKKDETGEGKKEAGYREQSSNPTSSKKHKEDEMDKNEGTAEHRGDPRNTSDSESEEDPEFRALVVDIYYPEPKRGSQNETTADARCNADKTQDPSPATPNASLKPEYHCIAHPTVKDLVYRNGPSEIMGMYRPNFLDNLVFKQPEYKRTRWIHLPMNHMQWLSDLAETVCTETCKDLNDNGEDADFPRRPGCEDAIFDYHYWLGHQSTRGTDPHSHIRHIQPQFRRLGMRHGKRTGFMVALPYVHFDTYGAVLKLKNKAAQLKKSKTNPSDPRYPLPLKDNEKTWETETGGVASGESEDSDNKRIWRDSEKRVPSTTLGVIHKDLYSPLPVHYRRTLSQFYFNANLQKTKQVVTEHFEENWPHMEPLVLMVDQLWMLVLVDGTIITCFPSQMGGSQQIFPYIYTDIVEGLLNSLRSEWRAPIESVLDVGYMIIQECIGFLFNQRARNNNCFRFLNIYEQQLSEIAASEANCFEELSKIVAKLPDTADTDRYETAARKCLECLLKLDKDMEIIAKINKLKHIRRELGVLLEVVATQVKVIRQMTDELEDTEEIDWKEFTKNPRLKSRRQRRAKKLEARSQILTNLDNKAESIIHNLELFVTRKEQQVQNLHSYFSSRLAERSSKMEVVILVLTGVTTLFAPLSLITAFLALQITEFPHDLTGENVSMPLSYALTWVLGVGLPVFVIIAVLALIFRAVNSSASQHNLRQALSTAAGHFYNSVAIVLVPPAASSPAIDPGEHSDDMVRLAPVTEEATRRDENGKTKNASPTIRPILESSQSSGSGNYLDIEKQ